MTGMIAFAAGCLAASASAIAAECGPARLEQVTLDRVTPEGDLILSDSRRIRLAGLHLDRIEGEYWPRPGETVSVGLLSDEKDRWSRLPAIVFIPGADGTSDWLQLRLLDRGVALARPEATLAGCWPLLTRAEALVQSKLPRPAAEPGRFARVSGRVGRVGDGRSAHFISLFDPAGERVSGLVQKRHLKRFRDAGVDVAQLRGHFITIRGTRSATNAGVIPLVTVDQIEIVR